MKSSPLLRNALAAGLALFSLTAVHAVETTFTSRAAWTTAVGGAADFTVDFNALALGQFDGELGNPATYDAGPFTLGKTADSTEDSDVGNEIIDAGGFGDRAVNGTRYAKLFIDSVDTGLGDEGDVKVELIFDTAVSAFGADFNQANQAGDDAKVMLLDAADGLIATLDVDHLGTIGFWGFTTDSPSKVKKIIFFADGGGANNIFGMDDASAAENLAVADTPPVAAETSIPDVGLASMGATSYSVVITYSDNNAVDVSTLGAGDITISGPGGSLTINSATPNVMSDGSPRVVTYQCTPPGGDWDFSDNGTYTVALLAGEVADDLGQFVPADANFATFEVLSGSGFATAHTDMTAFETAIGGAMNLDFMIDFEDFAADADFSSPAPPVNVPAMGPTVFTLGQGAGTNGFVNFIDALPFAGFPAPIDVNGTNYAFMFVDGDEPNTVEMIFTTPVAAWGAMLMGAADQEDLEIDLYDDGDVLLDSLEHNADGFFGFTSASPGTVKKIVFRAFGTGVLNNPFGMDDVKGAYAYMVGPALPKLYGISNGFGAEANNQIYEIDPATGMISNAQQVTLPGFTVTHSLALAADPNTGVLHAVIQTTGNIRRLVTINPTTGVATDIGTFPSHRFATLAFRPDGTLIGATGQQGADPETLFEISTVDASITLLLALGNGADGETIAFHPNGLLYHSSGNGTALFESVDLTTDTVTPIGSSNPEMFAMGYYPPSGQLLGSDIAGNLFSIDIATGARTPIGPINSPNLNRGLAFTGIVVAAPEIDVQGQGMTITSGDVTPDAADDTDFGDAECVVGPGVTRTFTILNTGTELTLTGMPFVTLSGSADFSVSQQPTSPVAAATGMTTFDITFAPGALGPQSAVVSIESDDADESPYTFTIAGNGVDTTPPTISGVKNIVLTIPGGSGTVTYTDPTASDSCDPAPTVDCVPPSGSTFSGVTTVTCTASDAAGNMAVTTFTITVLDVVPTELARNLTKASFKGDVASDSNAVGVPGGATINGINHAFTNDADEVLLEATLGNVPAANNVGVFSGPVGVPDAVAVKGVGGIQAFDHLVLSSGGDANYRSDTGADFQVSNSPSGGGGSTTAFPKADTQFVYQQAKSDLHEDAVTPGILKNGIGAVTTLNDTFIDFAGTTVREGDAVLVLPGETFGQLPPRAVVAPSADLTAFASSLRGGPQSTNAALFVGPVAGPWVPAARKGDTVGGTGGETLGSFAAEAVNDSGDFVARGTLLFNNPTVASSNNDILFTNRGGSLELLAREGDDAPCIDVAGVNFGSFDKLFIASDGTILFSAYLAGAVGSGNDLTLWRSTPSGQIELVAREGEQANNTEAFIAQILEITASPAGLPAFRARLIAGIGDATSTNNVGLWVESDTVPAPQLVLRQGDTYEVAPGDARTITTFSIDPTTNAQGGSGGYGQVVNTAGRAAVKLSLTGNLSGAVLTEGAGGIIILPMN